MGELTEIMLEKKIWAVVGSYQNQGKWAYKIYRRLKAQGYTVYAVNKTVKEVDGDPAYPSLAELPALPQVVNLVTPPEATIKLIDECACLGIKHVWMQPGADSQEAVEAAEKAGLSVLHNTCAYILT